MMRLKAIFLIAIFTALLAGSAIYLANDATVLSPIALETEHAQLQRVLAGTLADAESSLIVQATIIASDQTLVTELGSVREKLLTTTPEELRKTTGNTWNAGVFNRLVSLSEKMASDNRQQNAVAIDRKKTTHGDMQTQRPREYWWGDAPGLLLAFASVPRKDGSMSATLIAQGLKGKELVGGKRFEEDFPFLLEVAQTGKAQFTHFSWNGKMHAAAVVPVVQDGKVLGTVVIGNEFSREMVSLFAASLPKSIDLMVAYRTKDDRIHAEFVESNDRKDELLQAKYYSLEGKEVLDDKANEIPYSRIEPALGNTAKSPEVRTATLSDGSHIAMSRLGWFWNETEETDVYLVSDTRTARSAILQFRDRMIIAALVLFAIACLIALLCIQSGEKTKKRIRHAFADAISSGDPIDAQALAFLLDEKPENLSSYVLQKANSTDSPDDWGSLMLDTSVSDEEEVASSDDHPNAPQNSETFALYEEYMRLRKENHIDIPMTYEEFLGKLEASTNSIIEKYHCEKVSFLVHVNNGNVVLKPKIVKKSS